MKSKHIFSSFLAIMFCVDAYCVVPTSHHGRKIDAFNDIYPDPLMTSEAPWKVAVQDRLWYAIMFLQTERVRDLVTNRVRYGIDINYRPQPYLQSALIQICGGNSGANFMSSDPRFAREYLAITSILLAADELDFDLKDTFGRTALENCLLYGGNDTQMEQIRLILEAKDRRYFDRALKRRLEENQNPAAGNPQGPPAYSEAVRQ